MVLVGNVNLVLYMSLPSISDTSCVTEPKDGIYFIPVNPPSPIPSAIDCLTTGNPLYPPPTGPGGSGSGSSWPQPSVDPNLAQGPSPPTNFAYQLLNNKLDPTYNIYLTWTDPSSSVQMVEIYRSDLPHLVYFRGPPSGPTTTDGWLVVKDILDNSGNILQKKSPIVTDLLWDTTYVFNIRTIFFNVESLASPYSAWVQLIVYIENLEKDRINDRCPTISLETLQNNLSTNRFIVPKAYRYSRIVKGGSRQAICDTWRPKGWSNGTFPSSLYPITLKTDIEIAQYKEDNKGVPTCGPVYCNELPPVDISPYTSGLLFGSGIEIVANTKKYDTVNTPYYNTATTTATVINYGCNDTRKIGSKLKIN